VPSRPRFLENLAPRPDPVTTPHKHPSLSGDGSEMKGGEASAPHRHMDFGGSVGNQKEGRLFQPRFPISILHLYLCGFERGEDALEVHTRGGEAASKPVCTLHGPEGQKGNFGLCFVLAAGAASDADQRSNCLSSSSVDAS